MTQDSPPRKILNIQALRGVAVLLVVFFHMMTIEKKYGGASVILPGFLQFGMFGVDLFFVISGLVMVTVTRNKFQQPRQALRFLYHRISRIYPLYWFYSLLVLAVFLYSPSMVNSSQGGRVDILASFLILPQQQWPLLMVGWTLVHEMYFYFVFFLMLFLPEKHLVKGLAAWTAVIVLLQLNIPTASGPTLRLVSHPLTIEFIGGCLIGLITSEDNGDFSGKHYLYLAVLVTAVALPCFLFYQHTTGLDEPPGWWRSCIMGLPAMFIVYALVRAEQKKVLLAKPLCMIGDVSYSIYLSHILTLSLIGRIWAFFSSDSITDNLIVLPLMLLAVIGVGAVSYLYIERPLLVMSKKIA